MRPADYMPRLAFIRYLYKVAVDQSRLPLPMGAAAILGFQDAVELFLVLAADHLNVSIDAKSPFDKYFVTVDDALSAAGRDRLSGKTGMLQLNQARVGLKHYGNLPDEREIERFRSRVGAFFEDNIATVFDGTEFDKVSLVKTVKPDDVRDSLEEAQRLADADRLPDAIRQVGAAFWSLIADFHSRHEAAVGQMPFTFHAALTESAPPQVMDNYGYNPRLKAWDESNRTDYRIAKLEDMVAAMYTGLDIGRWVRFRMLTATRMSLSPAVSDSAEPSATPKAGDFQFCLDFVIDSAIRLQQFGLGTDKVAGNGTG